jgi:hypothetical protein
MLAKSISPFAYILLSSAVIPSPEAGKVVFGDAQDDFCDVYGINMDLLHGDAGSTQQRG